MTTLLDHTGLELTLWVLGCWTLERGISASLALQLNFGEGELIDNVTGMQVSLGLGKDVGGGCPPPSQATEAHQILPSTLTWGGAATEVNKGSLRCWEQGPKGEGTKTLAHLLQLDMLVKIIDCGRSASLKFYCYCYLAWGRPPSTFHTS